MARSLWVIIESSLDESMAGASETDSTPLTSWYFKNLTLHAKKNYTLQRAGIKNISHLSWRDASKGRQKNARRR